MNSQNIYTDDRNNVYINGEKVIMPKSLFFKNHICQVNNKTYLNGKEFKNGKWRYTLRSLFNTLF